MENEEVIHQEMEKTRASLSEKLEALEGQVGNTVTTTTEAVQNTSETVQQTVETVKETVEHVTEKVEEAMTAATEKFQETVQAVTDTFNFSRQFERHPWLMVGGAVTVGCILANVLGGSRREARRESVSSPQPAFPPPYSAPSTSYNAPSAAPASESAGNGNAAWVNEGLTRLKDVAISYLMGVVRDLAKRELPEAISGRVAEGVDDMTRKMGAQPIVGEVLPAAEDHDASAPDDSWNKSSGRQSKVGASR